jgi:hypothetical protein
MATKPIESFFEMIFQLCNRRKYRRIQAFPFSNISNADPPLECYIVRTNARPGSDPLRIQASPTRSKLLPE